MLHSKFQARLVDYLFYLKANDNRLKKGGLLRLLHEQV
jgi:hypothetical protein